MGTRRMVGRPLIEFLIERLPDESATEAGSNKQQSIHGGTRKGAGRKPLPGGRVTAAFVLRQDQADWLTAQAHTRKVSKSEIIRDLIDETLNLSSPR